MRANCGADLTARAIARGRLAARAALRRPRSRSCCAIAAVPIVGAPARGRRGRARARGRAPGARSGRGARAPGRATRCPVRAEGPPPRAGRGPARAPRGARALRRGADHRRRAPARRGRDAQGRHPGHASASSSPRPRRRRAAERTPATRVGRYDCVAYTSKLEGNAGEHRPVRRPVLARDRLRARRARVVQGHAARRRGRQRARHRAGARALPGPRGSRLAPGSRRAHSAAWRPRRLGLARGRSRRLPLLPNGPTFFHSESCLGGTTSQISTPIDVEQQAAGEPDALAVALAPGQVGRDDRRRQPRVEQPERRGAEQCEDGHRLGPQVGVLDLRVLPERRRLVGEHDLARSPARSRGWTPRARSWRSARRAGSSCPAC